MPTLAQARTSKFIITAAVIVFIAALYLAAEIIKPVALAILLSFLLAPVVRGLEKLHLPSLIAVVITVLLGLIVLGGILYMMYGQISDLANRLPAYQDNIRAKVDAVRDSLSRGPFSKVSSVITEISYSSARNPTTAPIGQGIAPVPVRVIPTSNPASSTSPVQTVWSALSYLSPLGVAGMVILLVMFMLLERDLLRDRVIKLAGQNRVTLTTSALADAGYRVSRYLGAQTLINFSYAVIISIGLSLIGVPNAILWGVLAGLFRFVPYIGPWIGASLPILLSLAVFPGYWHLIATIALFVVVEISTFSFVEPIFFGARTGLTPLAILVGAMFWAWLWGPLGLLMATPLTVCLVVLGKHVPSMQFLNVLLSDEEVLDPVHRYYQRIVAEHPEEAEDVVAEHLKEMSLPQIYESIVIPAIDLLSRDREHGIVTPQKYEHALQSVRDMVLAEWRPVEANPAILCIPARDQADEVTAMLFAQILGRYGITASYVPAESLTSEKSDLAAGFQGAAIVVSSLPPRAFAHARYIVQRLRTRTKDTPIIVGLWCATCDATRARRRMRVAGTEQVAVKFTEALELARILAKPSAEEAPARREHPGREHPGTKEHPSAETREISSPDKSQKPQEPR